MRIQRWNSGSELRSANDSQETSVGRRSLVEGQIRRKGSGAAEADAATLVQRAQGSGGIELPEGLRGRFESSLGADLGGVRVHTGADSAAAAASVGARAYALGQDVHFGAGEYTPGTSAGDTLLAHEVAHTVQQGGSAGATPQFALEVSQPGDAFETEADSAAAAMVTGQPAQVSRGSAGVSRAIIQREPAPAPGPAPAPTGAQGGCEEPHPSGMTEDERGDLREMARFQMLGSLIPYHDAILKARSKLAKQAKLKAEVAALLIDVGMGFLIPGFGVFSRPILTKVASGMSAQAIAFAAKIDGDAAKAGVTALTKSGVSGIKNNPGLFENVPAQDFLDTLLKQACIINSNGRNELTSDDIVTNFGALVAYDPTVVDAASYGAEIERLLAMFEEEVEGQGHDSISSPMVSIDIFTYAALLMNPASGEAELALVREGSATGHEENTRVFVQWVSPEMRDAAAKKTEEMTGSPPQMLPSPMVHGIPQ